MRLLYKRVLKPILFRFDPERVHDAFVGLGEFLGRYSLTRHGVAVPYGYHGEDAASEFDGLRYRTPVVLAAGFDYNARLTRILPSVGFGGVEVGSVTARSSPGNPKPRLRRLGRSHTHARGVRGSLHHHRLRRDPLGGRRAGEIPRRCRPRPAEHRDDLRSVMTYNIVSRGPLGRVWRNEPGRVGTGKGGDPSP
jgi:hypothetical protein